MNQLAYRLAADGVLLLHTLFVLFVLLGLLLIIVGALRDWRWVRNAIFRFVHLGAIGVVVVQAWLGIVCPLTTLEMYLRARAGEAVYPGSFVAHWLETLLYYQAPHWVFVTAYSIFAAAVVWCWYVVPPVRKPASRGTPT